MNFKANNLAVVSQADPNYTSLPVGTFVKVLEIFGQDSAGRFYYEVTDGVRSYFMDSLHVVKAFNEV